MRRIADLPRFIRYAPVHTGRPIFSGLHGGRAALRPVGAEFGVQEYMGYSEQMLEVFPQLDV